MGGKQKSSRQTQQTWAAKGQARVPDSEPEPPQASPWGRNGLPCPEYTWLLLHRLGSAVETRRKGWAGLQPSTRGTLGPMLALPHAVGEKIWLSRMKKIPFVIGAQVRRARWQQLWRALTPSGLPSRGQVRGQLREPDRSFFSSLVLR